MTNLTVFYIDQVQQPSPQTSSTCLDMDAPDCHPQRDMLHVPSPTPHVSSSKTPDLPSWTTFSSRSSSPSSKSVNESVHIHSPEKSHIAKQVDVGTDASLQLPELSHSAGKQASGAIVRRSSVFIGVVIPIRRPKSNRLERDTNVIGGVVSTNNKAEMDGKQQVVSRPAQGNSVSEDSAALTPVSNTLLSALTNTFERNKYPDSHTPQHSLGPASSTQLTLVRKAKGNSTASMPTGRSILKVIRPTQLRPLDIDALLGTAVAPIRIDRKRSEEARVSTMQVRFQLNGKIIGVGDGDGAGEAGESGGSHKRMVGDASGIYTELRQSRDAMYAERLETMFGPGSNSRGAGAKPKKVCQLPRIHRAMLFDQIEQGSKTVNGEYTNKSIASLPSTTASLSSTSRSLSPQSEIESTKASSVEAEIDPLVLGKRMRDLEEDEADDKQKRSRTEVVDVETASGWSTALQRLNKGKATLDRQVQHDSHAVLCRY